MVRGTASAGPHDSLVYESDRVHTGTRVAHLPAHPARAAILPSDRRGDGRVMRGPSLHLMRYHGPMKGHVLAVSLLAAACFDPTPPAGSPCGDDGACPNGQRCDSTERCVPESGEAVDAPSDAPSDADLDATIDAPIDGSGPLIVSFQTMSTLDTEATGTVEIGITLSYPAPPNTSVTVMVSGGSATRPADFSVPASTSVQFTPGQTLAIFPITVVQDQIDEDSETVTLALTADQGTVIGAIGAHTLTISDDDDAPGVSWDPAETNTSAPEGGAGVTTPLMWRLVLSAPSSRTISVPVTFTGNASSTSDYTIMAGDIPAVFPAGTSSKVVRVTVNGDAVTGPDENITMTIGAPTNATIGAVPVRVHIILNDD